MKSSIGFGRISKVMPVAASTPVQTATSNTALEALLHPFASVKVYVIGCKPLPAVAGLNSPLLTPVPLYTPPNGIPPIKSTEALLLQNRVFSGEKEIEGFEVILRFSDALDEHPLVSKTSTEYVVFVSGFTSIAEVVSPVFQEYEAPSLACKIVLEPEQMLLSPFIVAAAV